MFSLSGVVLTIWLVLGPIRHVSGRPSKVTVGDCPSRHGLHPWPRKCTEDNLPLIFPKDEPQYQGPLGWYSCQHPRVIGLSNGRYKCTVCQGTF